MPNHARPPWYSRTGAHARPPQPGEALRTVTISTLVNALGSGVWLTCSTIYLLTALALAPAEVAVVSAAAALAGFTAGLPLGRLGDEIGPLRCSILFLALEAGTAAALLLAHGFFELCVVFAALGALERGGSAVRGALIAGLFTGADRSRSRAVIRTAQNIGVGIGSAVGGLVLATGDPTWMRMALLANAVTFLLSAILTVSLPPVRPRHRDRARPTSSRVYRDRPYLLVIVTNALLFLHWPLLTVLLPIWIVLTRAPRWTIAVALILNTMIVTGLQLRASRGIEDPMYASKVMARVALAVAVACLVFASAGRDGIGAVAAVLVGVAVYSVAEVWQSASSFSLSSELAPSDAQGEYQGAFGTGISMARVVAPLVLIPLVTAGRSTGWLLLGAGFAILALVLPPATARAAVRIMARTAAGSP